MSNAFVIIKMCTINGMTFRAPPCIYVYTYNKFIKDQQMYRGFIRQFYYIETTNMFRPLT